MQLDGGSIVTAPLSAVPKKRSATSTATSLQSDDPSLLIGQPKIKDQRFTVASNITQIPMISQQHKGNHSNSHRPQAAHRPSATCEVTAEHTPLIDHRKTTWMNGFMMYSRMNRSKFLR